MLRAVGRALGSLLFYAAVTACGGRSVQTNRSPRPAPEEPLRPFGCEGEAEPRPAADVVRRTYTSGDDLRFEAVSENGVRVAYSAPAAEGSGRDLFVLVDGRDAFLAASNLGADPEGSSAIVRYESEHLIVLDGVVGDVAERLSVSAPAVQAGVAVDPTAVRASRDGRFVSFEENDRRRDQKPTADLVLLDVQGGVRTPVASLDRVRARFTRNSDFLVYSGSPEGDACPVTVERRSLGSGEVSPVTCIDTEARWEISRDDEWLVHAERWSHMIPDPSIIWDCPTLLMKTPLSGGESQVLADCMSEKDGKELDVGREGDAVSFLTPSEDPFTEGARLMIVPLQGGEPRELVASSVYEILEHTADAVAFTAASSADCGHERFMTVPEEGGATYDLGAATWYCLDTPNGVLTEHEGAFLVLSADRQLRLQHRAGEEPILLGCDIGQAVLLDDERVLFRGGGESGLFVYEPERGVINSVEDRISGPFGADPDLDGGYLAMVPENGRLALIHGWL